MRHAQRVSIGLGCVLSLLGCSNTAAPPNTTGPQTMVPTGTAGRASVAGTTGGGAAGTTTTPAPAGTTAPPTGTAGGTAVAGTSPTAGAVAAAGTGGSATTPVGGTGGGGAPTGQGFRTCGVAPKEGSCKATAPGVYAQQVDVDVWYQDENNNPPAFDPGRGTLTVWFKTEISGICEDGSGGTAVNYPCGSKLPGLYLDSIGGVVQIVFPDTLWDSPMIPSYSSMGSTTGFNPSDSLVLAKTAGTLGIELMDDNGTFPTFEQTVTFACKGGKTGTACYPDIDMDGKPGVTVQFQVQSGMPPSPGYDPGSKLIGMDWHYITAPLSIGGAALGAGATEAYIGLRTRVGGSGVIGADCKSGVGGAEVDDFESRVVGCKQDDGMPCKESGENSVEFLDKNTPIFHALKPTTMPPTTWKHSRPEADALLNRAASAGPKVKVVRLGDLGQQFTCAQIRGAAYPAN